MFIGFNNLNLICRLRIYSIPRLTPAFWWIFTRNVLIEINHFRVSHFLVGILYNHFSVFFFPCLQHYLVIITNPQYVLLRHVLLHRIQAMLFVPLRKLIYICILRLQAIHNITLGIRWALSCCWLHLNLN